MVSRVTRVTRHGCPGYFQSIRIEVEAAISNHYCACTEAALACGPAAYRLCCLPGGSAINSAVSVAGRVLCLGVCLVPTSANRYRYNPHNCGSYDNIPRD